MIRCLKAKNMQYMHVRKVSKKGELPLMAIHPQVRTEIDPQTETSQKYSTPHN